jgi:hypothetical protein
MNAEFFALAFTAALNPKLLAVDLLLIENRRPRAMFLCVPARRHDRGPDDRPAGRATVHAGVISSQGRPSSAPT